MATTLFPQEWFDVDLNTENSESEPIRTLCCKAAGINPKEEEIGVLELCDQEAIEALVQARTMGLPVRIPACDNDHNLAKGSIFAVVGADGEYCRLVWLWLTSAGSSDPRNARAIRL